MLSTYWIHGILYNPTSLIQSLNFKQSSKNRDATRIEIYPKVGFILDGYKVRYCGRKWMLNFYLDNVMFYFEPSEVLNSS